MVARVLLALAACLAISACGSGAPHAAPAAPAPAAPAAPAPAAPAASLSTSWTPVATVLGSDQAAQATIATLLDSHGIKWAMVGSLGYTVSVPASRADEARALLREKIDQGLRASTVARRLGVIRATVHHGRRPVSGRKM